METKSAITALAALTQESRLTIFCTLVTISTDGLAATKIAEQLEVPSSLLLFHLKVLSHAGLILLLQDGSQIS